MSLLARRLLSLLGVAGFLALWQLVVWASRPEPIRRPTLAFSAAHAGRAAAVVMDDRGRVVVARSLDLRPGAAPAAAESLRVWLRIFQPTLAALPPRAADALPPRAADALPLRSLIDESQRDYGGGLDVYERATPAGLGAEAEARERARLLQREKSVRPSWLPGPWDALQALAQMTVSGELLRHAIASLFRVSLGFALATAIGIPLGLALGGLAWLSSLTNAIIQCLRPISPIAWLPVATLLLGGGDVAAVFLIFLAAFLPIVVSTASAVGTVDLKYRRSALNFGVRGLALAHRVVLPAAFPQILTALRIALGISWLVVVAAEMLGVESGLGFLVLDARNQLRYDRVVAAMIVIGLIGLLLDGALRSFERGQLERRGLGTR